MRLRTLWTIALLAQLSYCAFTQVRSSPFGIVTLPQGPVTRIPSPNGRWTLIFECPDSCRERKLWLEDGASQKRKLVREYRRSLAVAWAPNGTRFFVEDDYGSNGASSYVVDPETLNIIDPTNIIANSDEKATEYLNAGHAYVRAKRWINSHELVIVLAGHFDEPPARAFTIVYRVDLDGSAKRISWRSKEESQ